MTGEEEELRRRETKKRQKGSEGIRYPTERKGKRE
jgi:hypothetical protein